MTNRILQNLICGTLKIALLVVSIFLSSVEISSAYIDPGSGIIAKGNLWVVVGVVIIAIVGILLWPINILLGWISKRKRKKRSFASPKN